ncbi:MAG: hypothetical protein STSR0009_19980 [Methanoregula sp.]
MSKIVGIRPQQETQKLIEKFEDEVLIRYNNQQLLGTVYVDMQEDRWAVAFAYNLSKKPGIHGHENAFEVRYSCPVQENGSVQMFRSDDNSERTVDAGRFKNGDDFIRFAITQERTFVGKAA